MLYEVITEHLRHQEVAGVRDLFLPRQKQRAARTARLEIRRITSYNVCYTKLLRKNLLAAGQEKVRRINAQLDRIIETMQKRQRAAGFSFVSRTRLSSSYNFV